MYRIVVGLIGSVLLARQMMRAQPCFTLQGCARIDWLAALDPAPVVFSRVRYVLLPSLHFKCLALCDVGFSCSARSSWLVLA